MATINFKVTGMHCTSCKHLIESVLSDLPGAVTVQVDPSTGAGSLQHDGQVSFDQVSAVIAELKEYSVEQS